MDTIGIFKAPTYNSQTMSARFDWRIRSRSPRPEGTPSRRLLWNGRLLIASLTVVFLFWVLVRLFTRPAWVYRLPPALGEIIRLGEVVWFLTLVLLWLIVLWQRWRRMQPTILPVEIEDLYALSPSDFEGYVAELFRHKGYEVHVRGRSGDHGVDLMITKPGGKRAIAQCKRYRRTIGPEIVRELYGTLMHERVSHAFLVTTAGISDSAREWAQGKPMTLIDGEALAHVAAALMNDVDNGPANA